KPRRAVTPPRPESSRGALEPSSAPLAALASRRHGDFQSTPRAEVTNRVMTVVLATCLVITLTPLFLILSFILIRGAPGLPCQFFTQLPEPPGEGGGLGHAMVGSALIVGVATVIAVPFAILA